MTTCKRFYRKCDEFALCVNIGKKDYVTIENPKDRFTIFQYNIYGGRRAGEMFKDGYIESKVGELMDVSEHVNKYVIFHATEDFFTIGFNTNDKNQGWEGRLLTESQLDLSKLVTPEITNKRYFILCLNGKPIVNGKKLKRYDYSEVYQTKVYDIKYNDGVIGLFTKL